MYIACGTVSAELINRAIAKYDIKRYNAARRNGRTVPKFMGPIWLEMKAKGFSILDRQDEIAFPFPVQVTGDQ